MRSITSAIAHDHSRPDRNEGQGTANEREREAQKRAGDTSRSVTRQGGRVNNPASALARLEMTKNRTWAFDMGTCALLLLRRLLHLRGDTLRKRLDPFRPPRNSIARLSQSFRSSLGLPIPTRSHRPFAFYRAANTELFQCIAEPNRWAGKYEPSSA